MGSIGIWQVAILGIVVLILFGRGRISEMMGDFGKGISSFKKGMSEDDSKPAAKSQIEAPAADPAPAETKTSEKTESSN